MNVGGSEAGDAGLAGGPLSRKRTSIVVGVVLLVAAAGGTVLTIRLLSGNRASSPTTTASVPQYDPEVLRTARFNVYEGKELSEMTPEERAWYLVDELVWANADFADAEATADLIARWRAGSLRDPDGLLSARQRDQLLQSLAEHARVRARSTPDAYVALTDATTGLEWNDGAAVRENGHVKGAFTTFVEAEVPAEVGTQEILRQAWEGLAKHGHVFDRIGVGEDGAAFLVRRVRTEREAMTQGLHGKNALDRAYWDGQYFQAGMPFAVEDRTLAQALESAPSALVVNSHVLVKMRDGRIANWICVWFYDEAIGRWRTEYMQMSTSKVAKVVW